MYIQESITQLVIVSNANSPICFSPPLLAADRQRNYLDHMSIAARQQQWDHEQQVETRARLTNQQRQQQRYRDREQHAEAHARVIDQQHHQQRDRDREQH